VLNGRYLHKFTGIEFDLPPGCSVQGTVPSSDNGEIAILFHADFPDVYAAVWMVRDRIPLAKIAARLPTAIPEKINQRKDFEKYAIRPGSVDSTWISEAPSTAGDCRLRAEGPPDVGNADVDLHRAKSRTFLAPEPKHARCQLSKPTSTRSSIPPIFRRRA
jgi:hypothetical protein